MSEDFFGLVRFFDSWFDNLTLDLGRFNYPCPSFPPANIRLEKNKDLLFEFAVAGYPQDNISIEFLGDHLVLKGRSAAKKCEDGVTELVRHISSASFENRYFVPSDKYDKEATTAEWHDGLLKVAIPSREKREAKTIQIKKV